MKGTGRRLKTICKRVRRNPDSFEIEEKRTTLEVLQIKVVVTEEEAMVTGNLGIQGAAPDLSPLNEHRHDDVYVLGAGSRLDGLEDAGARR